MKLKLVTTANEDGIGGHNTLCDADTQTFEFKFSHDAASAKGTCTYTTIGVQYYHF